MKPPRAKNFQLQNATCNSNLKPPPREENVLGVAGRNILCHRQKKDPVIVSLEADTAIVKDGQMQLPEIPTYPPPPEKQLIPIPYCQPSTAINVVCGGAYGNVVWNGTNVDRRELVTYNFSVLAAGAYDLYIKYGAGEPRPVKIEVTPSSANRPVNNALGIANNCWNESCIRTKEFTRVGQFFLMVGENHLTISRDYAFPHLYAMEFRPSAFKLDLSFRSKPRRLRILGMASR
jgi:hypothetical protein